MNEQVRPVRSIGEYVPMIDGPEKVSGRAKYAGDFFETDAMAGRIFRSPHAHAEILEVDVSEAEKLPGVHAIVTGAEELKTGTRSAFEHPDFKQEISYIFHRYHLRPSESSSDYFGLC